MKHRWLLPIAISVLIPIPVRADLMSTVPVPRVEISGNQLEMSASIGDEAVSSFSVTNVTSCSALVYLHTPRDPVFGAKCFSRVLGAGETDHCEVTYRPQSVRKNSIRIEVYARVGDDCKVVAVDRLREVLNAKLEPFRKEDERLKTAIEEASSEEKRAQLEQEQLAKEVALTKRQETADKSEEAEIVEAQDHVSKTLSRIDLALNDMRWSIQTMERDEPPGIVALNQRITKVRTEASNSVMTAKVAMTRSCDNATDLRGARKKILAEMMAGRFHNLCGLTESEILEQKHQSLADHLRDSGGVMVEPTPEMVKQKMDKYDAELERAEQACLTDTAELDKKKEQGIAQVHELEGLAEQLKERHAALLEKKRAELIDHERQREEVRANLDSKVIDLQREHSVQQELRAVEMFALKEKSKKDLATFDSNLRAELDKLYASRRNVKLEIDKLENQARREEVAIANAHLKEQRSTVLVRAQGKR